MKSSAEVLVLGGGLIGLACARALAREGRSVTLLERTVPGAGASSAAAGMLAPLGDATGPLAAVAQVARNGWPAWRDELQSDSGLAIEMDLDGALLVALDEADEVAIEEVQTQALALGERFEPLGLATAHARVPELSLRLRRAVHLPGERRVDNVAVVAALTRAATAAGVRVLTGFDGARVELGPNGVRVFDANGRRTEGDWLVLAAGVGSAALPGLPPLPVRPVRGQMLRLEGVHWSWDGIVRRPALYSVRRGESSLLIGATVEPDAGLNRGTSRAGIRRLREWTRKTFPRLSGHAVGATWAGLRPDTPDHLPLLGPLPAAPRVIAATGHYRNGVLLAPWTAEVIAETVRTGKLPARATAFASGRFAFSP